MKLFRVVLTITVASFLVVTSLLITGTSAVADPGDELDAIFFEAKVASARPAGTSPRATALDFEVLAHVDPGAGTTGDVFGYRGHAYLGSWVGIGCLSKGVRVYDLQNPRDPRLASTFADKASDPSVANTWTEKTVVQHVNTPFFKGDLAAVSFQTCGRRLDPTVFRGFGLYDVSDPAHPTKLALYATEPGVNNGSHEIWLQNVGDRAYVYTAIPLSELRTTKAKADFRIIDVTDPRHPVQVGQWGAWKELGIHPLTGLGPNPRSFVHSVIVNEQATLAFLSYWDTGTVILDISDPTAPRFLGRTTFVGSEQGNAHSAAIARGDGLLVETREAFEGIPVFFDVTDPTRPTRLAAYANAAFMALDTVHDPKIRGSLTYLSYYDVGIVALDSSRPASPRLVAQFRPDPTGLPINPDFFCTVSCVVFWGVFVDRDYVLGSDMNGGLWVLKIRG